MRIVWSREAQDDVFDILFRYDAIDPALATEMSARIDRSPFPLGEFPLLGEEVAGGAFRKWSVAGTPFVLLYAPGDDRIEIRRVLHGASDWRP